MFVLDDIIASPMVSNATVVLYTVRPVNNIKWYQPA